MLQMREAFKEHLGQMNWVDTAGTVLYVADNQTAVHWVNGQAVVDKMQLPGAPSRL